MKKKTFTVPEVPGSTRSSHRDYTHAVIGQFNYDKAIATASKIESVDKSNFNYSKRCSECQVGEAFGQGFNFSVDQKMIDNGKAEVAKYKTAQEYAEAKRDERVQRWTNEKAKAMEQGGQQYVVLQWSQSFQNAMKGTGGRNGEYYLNVKVVETKQVK